MSSQQELQLDLNDRLYEQQSDVNPSMAKNDTPPGYDPGLTKSITDSSHKLLDDLKATVKELSGDAETIDGGECTVTDHSHGLPTRQISPEIQKAAVVPKFGSWDGGDSSPGDRFNGIFDKIREINRNGMATSGGDDSESPGRGTTISGVGSKNFMHGGRDVSDCSYEFTTGNIIYSDSLRRADSQNDRSAPESTKQPWSEPERAKQPGSDPESEKQPGSTDTKRHHWYRWRRTK
ncbi:hypothetical protein MKX01_003929 [Papaver californicum]|nr:hypothetical protein MKX01_003929 [Papaver californicum]